MLNLPTPVQREHLFGHVALPPWLEIAANGDGASALIKAAFIPVGLLRPIANDLAISNGLA
ncbi:MAG: hypothetical protein ABS955_01930 [Stenotrophomonas maltophilia]